jgi:hypothetical protein
MAQNTRAHTAPVSLPAPDFFWLTGYFWRGLHTWNGLLAQNHFSHPHVFTSLLRLHPPLFELILIYFQLIQKSTYLANGLFKLFWLFWLC